MKKEILCMACGKASIRYNEEPKSRLEFVHHETGDALNNYHCDLCNASIIPGDGCVARSIGHVIEHPYYQWEDDYIYIPI